jgi:hypothetical protein
LVAFTAVASFATLAVSFALARRLERSRDRQVQR